MLVMLYSATGSWVPLSHTLISYHDSVCVVALDGVGGGVDGAGGALCWGRIWHQACDSRLAGISLHMQMPKSLGRTIPFLVFCSHVECMFS